MNICQSKSAFSRFFSVMPPYPSLWKPKGSSFNTYTFAKWIALILLFSFLTRDAYVFGAITEAEINSILKAHNDHRRKHEIGRMLVWSEHLSQLAQRYLNSKGCNQNTPHSKSGGCGENIYFRNPVPPGRGADAVANWITEKITDNDYKKDGHHTQVLWADTLMVGCAYVTGGDGCFSFLCNYYPPGNVYSGGERKSWKIPSETCTLTPNSELRNIPPIRSGHCAEDMARFVKGCVEENTLIPSRSLVGNTRTGSSSNSNSGSAKPNSLTSSSGTTGQKINPGSNKPQAYNANAHTKAYVKPQVPEPVSAYQRPPTSNLPTPSLTAPKSTNKSSCTCSSPSSSPAYPTDSKDAAPTSAGAPPMSGAYGPASSSNALTSHTKDTNQSNTQDKGNKEQTINKGITTTDADTLSDEIQQSSSELSSIEAESAGLRLSFTIYEAWLIYIMAALCIEISFNIF